LISFRPFGGKKLNGLSSSLKCFLVDRGTDTGALTSCAGTRVTSKTNAKLER
jgi:hypothetical protein